ncbi:MAG: hypothetical protein HYU69_00570 [Bacteroidetes bacterium]|nr:hypothetical protein [Bacteroidota bacterium]
MTEQEDIFDLIRSLSQTEKRYFKIFSSRHIIGKENDYVKLFNAIDKQKHYDEKSLINSLQGRTIKDNFHVAKNYLYKMILKSMRGYRLDGDIDNNINGLINDAIFLYDKLLYAQSLRLLKRVKKLAYRYERFTDILRIINMERKITVSMVLQEDIMEKYKNIEKEERNVLELLQNISEYKNLSIQIHALIVKNGEVKNPEGKKIVIKKIGPKVLTDESKALSYTAKCFFYDAISFYYKLLADYQKSYEYRKKRLQLFDLYPEQQMADENNYIAVFHNLMGICVLLDKPDEFMEYLINIRKIDFSTIRLKAKAFLSSYLNETDFYLSKKEFAKALYLVPQVTKGLNLYRGKFNKYDEVILYYNLAYCYLFEEQYSKSLYWLNLLLNDPQAKISPSFYSFSLILNIIIYYEQGNIELLPYLLKSTHRHLTNTNQLYKTEIYFLDFFKKLLKSSKHFDLKKELIKLKDDIQSLKAPHEKQVLQYFDFVYWIDKKIEKIVR